VNVLVRMAEMVDLGKIKEIADEFRDELGFVYEAELIRGVRDRSVIVAEVDGQVVGFNYFRCRKDRKAVIYAIAVTSQFQRRGIGRLLLRKFIEIARQRGCVEVELKCPAVSLGANLFYKRCGFKFCGIVDGKKQKLVIWKLAI